MKFKTILACAVLGLVIFNGRLNAAVESDVVGYSTIEIQPGFNLLALPFNDLSSSEGIDVQNLLSGEITQFDTLQYWDGVKLQTLTYRVRSGVGAWYSGNKNAEKKFLPGEGFWYNSRATEKTELSIAGRVENATLSVAANEMVLIGSPLPKATALSDITFDGITANASLQYWNGTSLEKLTYRVRNNVGGWYNGTTLVTDQTILPATGFWFSAKSAVDITF